jgi:hypothetical protein
LYTSFKRLGGKHSPHSRPIRDGHGPEILLIAKAFKDICGSINLTDSMVLENKLEQVD